VNCAILGYVANHFINEALNPASNIFHLANYVFQRLMQAAVKSLPGHKIRLSTSRGATYVLAEVRRAKPRRVVYRREYGRDVLFLHHEQFAGWL